MVHVKTDSGLGFDILKFNSESREERQLRETKLRRRGKGIAEFQVKDSRGRCPSLFISQFEQKHGRLMLSYVAS